MKKENNDIEIIEASATVIEEEVRENKFKTAFRTLLNFFKKFKSGKLKNEALFKRGSYSLVITALVLVALIIFNWLVSSLANRFNLEFDMTAKKKNSISQDNIDYIKKLDADVTVTVCATEELYVDYMYSIAQQEYGVMINSYSELEYFNQTLNLMDKYHDFNDKISINFVDPQSTEFTAIRTNYSNYNLVYGDILVTSTANDVERVKVLRFSDIYVTEEDTDSYYYYYYGTPTYTLSANRLETALTSAIAYVTSTDTKKVAVLSGHNSNNTNYTDAYMNLLSINNYDITTIDDKLITSISSEYDAIIISAPNTDFIGSELDVISAFLENDGKLGKGLIYFADAAGPSLPNLYAFLKQWGIEVGEGILFETDSNYQVAEPSTILSFPVALAEDKITESMLESYAITDYNVPMKVCDASTYERTATALLQTTESTVVAPIGSAKDWSDYTDDDKQKFDCVIQSVEEDVDKENQTITSYVMAFSSVEFVSSIWADYDQLCNKNITISATDRASHVGDTSMKFTAKVIDNESFADAVNARSVKIVNVIFMFLIPITVVIVGIIVFIRRRNAR